MKPMPNCFVDFYVEIIKSVPCVIPSEVLVEEPIDILVLILWLKKIFQFDLITVAKFKSNPQG